MSASEAFDRLWTVRIVQDFPLPPLLGADNPGAWFAAVALVGRNKLLPTPARHL